jgi:hypothetical protein
LVVPDKAETTIMTRFPSARFNRARSQMVDQHGAELTLVPPNFITIHGLLFRMFTFFSFPKT